MKLWEDPRIVRGMDAQLELRRRRLRAGEAPLGWKVGFAAPAMLERLGISGPLVGFLLRSARVRSGTSVSFDGWSKPGDYVDLRAEMDALVAISNCPQIYNPCNGGKPTPIRLVTYDPAG